MRLTARQLVELDAVIPVVVVENAADAVPLALALRAGGLRTIEVTLRSAAALEAITRITTDVPDMLVGAGTVVSEDHVRRALAAGAHFLVSPGATPRLLDALESGGVPFLPGCATPSEVVALLERGISVAKFFPAEAAGGATLLRSLAGPFPDMRFCPTGGLDVARARVYLRLPNVACVGGTWLVRQWDVENRDWARISELAQDAAGLRTEAL